MPSARVLIVEDEAEWQNLVQELLTDEGHTCQVADSYASALAHLGQDSFNVIFLDMLLQEFGQSVRTGSGWRLLNYLVEQHPRTKIIVLSGRATAGDAARLVRDYPIAAFIDKGEPDVETQILAAVSQALQAPALRIQTFGQFNLWRNGQLVDAWDEPAAKTVVKLLLVRRVAAERAVAPDELSKWLWPEADAATGRKQLLPAITGARHALEPDREPRDSNFILRSSAGYYFDLSGEVTWDVPAFRQWVRAGAAHQQAGDLEAARADYEAARALYRDDFLAEDRQAPWALPPREALQTEYGRALEALAEVQAGLGHYAEAIRAGEAALGVDPLRENLYRQLMRYHSRAGNKTKALKVYRDCEKLFGEMFGEGLAPQTRRLYEAISTDAPLEGCSDGA